MLIEPTKRFGATAENYAKFRPTYPDELIDWIISSAGVREGDRIVDVACGTGIASRAFAARRFDVTGVDPSEAMLEKARQAGGARYVQGEAARTGLPDASANLITVAQAFHWLAFDDVMPEFRRVLAPNGSVAALWNLRGDGPQMDAYDALLLEHSSEYAEYSGRWQAVMHRIASLEGVKTSETVWVAEMDWERLLGRVSSASYVVHGVADRTAFESALRAFFDRHQRNGLLSFDYRSVGYVWR